MAIANLIGNYSAGEPAIGSDVDTDLRSLLARVNSITSEQLAASAVLESNINALAVTTGKLAAGVLSADATGRGKMADGYLTRAKLAADAKTSYLQVVDEQTSGTEGGAVVSGAWTVLPLNTIYDNPDSIAASVSSNEVTLPAGTYYMKFHTMFFGGVSFHRTRLYNVTDTAVQTNTGGNDMYSLSGYNGSVALTVINSVLAGAFTLAAAKALKFEYIASSGDATDGLGRAGSFAVEVYRTAEFWKYSD